MSDMHAQPSERVETTRPEPRTADKPNIRAEFDEAYRLMMESAQRYNEREEALETSMRDYAKSAINFAWTVAPPEFWDAYRIKQSDMKPGDESGIRLSPGSQAFLRTKA